MRKGSTYVRSGTGKDSPSWQLGKHSHAVLLSADNLTQASCKLLLSQDAGSARVRRIPAVRWANYMRVKLTNWQTDKLTNWLDGSQNYATKRKVPRLTEKFPTLYGTRSLPLLCPVSIKSTPCYRILFAQDPVRVYVFRAVTFLRVSPTNPDVSSPLPKHAAFPVHLILLDLMMWSAQIMKLPITQFSPVFCFSLPVRLQKASSAPSGCFRTAAPLTMNINKLNKTWRHTGKEKW